jgi:tyrosyl-tRNA synthetase
MPTHAEFVDILEARGFLHQASDREGLEAKLKQGAQSAYIGFDATASSLHVGNLMGIMMLYWWQQCGNKPYTLMGGGTTKVGDPSGKTDMRKMLDDDGINANINSIKRVFSKFLKYGDGPSDAVMVNNDDWLQGIDYLGFLRDYGRHFSINRMLTFDSVKLRLEREQPLTFLEFNYMILQAYDYVELHRRYGISLQMGGSDQWGNIINGVELGRRVDGLELFGVTCPLITTSSGAKMGKSAQGAMWLNADMLSPYDYWQFWRNTEDADVGRFLKFYTVMPLDEIAKLEALGGAEINEAKKVLAYEATKLCHGVEAADAAAETAKATFEAGGVGDDLPSVDVPEAELQAGISVVELMRRTGLVESNGEGRRLVQGGGARINDQPVNDVAATASLNDITQDGYIKLSAGKKKHALIRVG